MGFRERNDATDLRKIMETQSYIVQMKQTKSKLALLRAKKRAVKIKTIRNRDEKSVMDHATETLNGIIAQARGLAKKVEKVYSFMQGPSTAKIYALVAEVIDARNFASHDLMNKWKTKIAEKKSKLSTLQGLHSCNEIQSQIHEIEADVKAFEKQVADEKRELNVQKNIIELQFQSYEGVQVDLREKFAALKEELKLFDAEPEETKIAAPVENVFVAESSSGQQQSVDLTLSPIKEMKIVDSLSIWLSDESIHGVTASRRNSIGLRENSYDRQRHQSYGRDQNDGPTTSKPKSTEISSSSSSEKSTTTTTVPEMRTSVKSQDAPNKETPPTPGTGLFGPSKKVNTRPVSIFTQGFDDDSIFGNFGDFSANPSFNLNC